MLRGLGQLSRVFGDPCSTLSPLTVPFKAEASRGTSKAGSAAPTVATALRAASIRANAAWVNTDNPRSGLYPWISLTSSWARK